MQQLKIVPTDNLAHESSLDEIARQGARELLKHALAQEVSDYISANKDQRDDRGHRLVVRNGKAVERTVTTSAGRIQIQAPRVLDRREGAR